MTRQKCEGEGGGTLQGDGMIPRESSLIRVLTTHINLTNHAYQTPLIITATINRGVKTLFPTIQGYNLIFSVLFPNKYYHMSHMYIQLHSPIVSTIEGYSPMVATIEGYNFIPQWWSL